MLHSTTLFLLNSQQELRFYRVMGGEYISKPMQSFLAKHDISHHKSCPYSPEHNGLAERKHKYMVQTTITPLQNAN